MYIKFKTCVDWRPSMTSYVVWIERYLPLLTDGRRIQRKFPNFDVRGAALVEYLDQHPPPWRKEQFGVPTLYNVAELHIRCLHNSWWFLIFFRGRYRFCGIPNCCSECEVVNPFFWCHRSWCRTSTRCFVKLNFCNHGCRDMFSKTGVCARVMSMLSPEAPKFVGCILKRIA